MKLRCLGWDLWHDLKWDDDNCAHKNLFLCKIWLLLAIPLSFNIDFVYLFILFEIYFQFEDFVKLSFNFNLISILFKSIRISTWIVVEEHEIQLQQN